MKKLFVALVITLLSTVAFAQTKPATKMAQKAKLHCYFMKDGAMEECWGDKATAMSKDATLKNGTKVITKGKVVMKDGKMETLKNGECILAENGKIGPLDKMHPKKHHAGKAAM